MTCSSTFGDSISSPGSFMTSRRIDIRNSVSDISIGNASVCFVGYKTGTSRVAAFKEHPVQPRTLDFLRKDTIEDLPLLNLLFSSHDAMMSAYWLEIKILSRSVVGLSYPGLAPIDCGQKSEKLR